MGIPAPQIALKHLRQVVSLYRIWRTKLLDLTSQVAIFHYLLLHPLRPPDNYWSPSGDDVSVSFSFGNGWVDRCNTLKEQLYRSLENVPAAANTNGQTKDDNRLIPHVSIKCGLKSLPIPDLSMADTENPQPTC